MSRSCEVSSLGSISRNSHLPGTDAIADDVRQDSGSIHRDASQQQLLRHSSHDEFYEAMPYHDLDHAVLPPRGKQEHSTNTTGLDSPSLSRFSYDSLEESPIHDGGQPPTVRRPTKESKAWSWRPTSIWTTEILSCVIAALSLGAIVATLSVHQGLPLPQWPLRITINALVSVFTGIFKIALTVPLADGEQALAQ